MSRPPQLASDGGSRSGAPLEFVASSPAMLSIWDMVDRVAETDVPVLIRGESGVGGAAPLGLDKNASARRALQRLGNLEG